MSKRIKWVIGFFIFIFVATFAFHGFKMIMIRRYMAHFVEPPIYVSATKATTETWHPYLSAVGSLKASNGVDVNSEVSGQITAIDFQSGEHVKQGDLLVQLNDSVDQQALE